MSAQAPPLTVRNVQKTFRRETGEEVNALADVSFTVGRGALTALVGPDGAGKTTLIRLAAALIMPDSGEIEVAGVSVRARPQQVQDRIGYMPQRFGLYEDLSVQENLDLYADLHGISAQARVKRYERLMEMTALGPFRERLAGRLSGGMKQKLGLACTLVRSPELLLLDEPTVGVDPLSRRELWDIVLRLVREEGHSVLVSTSYLDEAEHCDHAIVLYAGKVLAQGAPADITAHAKNRTFLVEPPRGESARALQARLLKEPDIIDAVPQAGCVRIVRADESGTANLPSDEATGSLKSTPPRFEDGFMILLHALSRHEEAVSMMYQGQPEGTGAQITVEVKDLVRKFGAFTAVDHISFNVKRGEIFGLLGPNGAGKTTTFRMLCGLLPASGGTLRVAGADLGTSRATARQHVGYMAQKFSLYGQLSVKENLDFFASAYGLFGRRRERRIQWAMEQFDLARFSRLPSAQLPGGYKQRLALAAALLHEPDILFLDEATSGADPLARREFWSRINSLAEHGVTVIITTHFMEEAEYCDRAVIMDSGKLLAEGTPAQIRSHAQGIKDREPTIEDAFIAVVEKARQGDASAKRDAA